VSRSLLVNALAGLLLVVLAATIIGLVTLWPEDQDPLTAPAGAAPSETESARVVGVREVRCGPSTPFTCMRVEAELGSGKRTSFTVARAESQFGVGDRIRVYRTPRPDVQVPGVRIDEYGFSDFERRRPLLLLLGIFATLVIVTSRWQGVRALLGLAASLLVIVFFVVPAILAGESPAGVALVGSLAVMFATIPLAHGLGPKTVAACLGTTAALLLTLWLADLFTGVAHLSGISSEEAVFLRASNESLSLQGLLLAGMVIAALGVLDDLTVSQASTVMALRRANPGLGFRPLFTGALSVGHDHIAATVNTLVLAYAGASLPILLVFGLANTPFLDATNFESVAEAIVATLVGSIGLIAAVPVTTALAALLALKLGRDQLESDHTGHAH
jgi:uncharacterized membrane protein